MKHKPNPSLRVAARLTRVGLAAAAIGLGATAATGCLDREVSPAQPNTTNVFVQQIVQDAVNKIDLLFMIDNSISMADKQKILEQAVPQLLNRLLDPLCQNEAGDLVPKVNGLCPDNYTEEFDAIDDIHIGVISSSLGGHGGVLCSPELGNTFDPTMDDRGELIAGLRGITDTYNGMGFLKWDPQAQYVPPGAALQGALVQSFTDLVSATGEQGCGYEASLEAWYRFLIDPQPPVNVYVESDFSQLGDVNTTLLNQRGWFLRPDSLVAIIMLSDENDCSIRDDGVGWLVGIQNKRLPRGTEACLSDPNNICCRSCALQEAAPPENCLPLGSDPSCQSPAYSATEEPLNLRCFDQKRRFGIDFLYPWTRYVSGLKEQTVPGRACGSDVDCPSYDPSQVAGRCISGRCEYINPLFSENLEHYADLVPRQDAGLVFLAGIVGVPWQDIATEASLQQPDTLEYLRTTEDPNNPGADTLVSRWDVIVGNPDTNERPEDPFMVESVDPRDGMGTNPIVNIAPSPVTAAVNIANVNGHEYTIPLRDDLQYACIFELDEARDCTSAEGGCDCKENAAGSQDRPLCQAPGTTNFGTTQYFAKAYPGTRFLKVLKEYGTNSIVASVCPKITDPARANEPGYGYNPAVKAIIDRLKEKLKGACLPRALQLNEDGTVACQVVEATNPTFGVTCGTAGREEIDPEVAKVVRRELRTAKRCGDDPGQVACDSVVLCGIRATSGDDLARCLNDPDEALGNAPIAGYCYIDAMQDVNENNVVECDPVSGGPDCIGNPALVADCDSSQRRILRIVSREVSPPVPFGTSTLFVACQGKPLGS